MNPLIHIHPLVGSLLLLAMGPVDAADWPQWLGPHRNGHYPGADIQLPWPENGPKQIWKTNVGQGFSGPVVADGKVIMFHRLDDRETVDCLDAENARRLWRFDYPTQYRDDFGFDEGPRATPTIADGRVFTFGAQGMLSAVDFQSGKKLWQIDTRKQYKAGKGFFGMASSPLVTGDLVMVNVGGPGGAGMIAWDTATGELRWKTSDHEASYASPVLATVRSEPYAFFYDREALQAVTLNGKVAWEFPWRPSMNASVNAATPLVIEDLIFVSTSYGKGAALVRFKESGPEVVWKGDDSLSNHYSTSLHHKGFLYGFHGRQEQGAALRCVELLTGKVLWNEDGLGSGWVLEASDHLLILTERGEWIAARSTPDGFKPVARAQILGTGTRPCPALARGQLFARDKTRLVCVDLRTRGDAAER